MNDDSNQDQSIDHLSKEDQLILLHLAREALSLGVNGQTLPPLDKQAIPSRLLEPGATFVTLTMKGELRGCIGSLEASRPLAEDVRIHAVAAALEDYRFQRVRPEEVAQIIIEISKLTTPQLLGFQDEIELLSQIRPGIDGVILRMGVRRATFLPQVWKKVPEVEEFLALLCRKMGSPPDCWHDEDVQVLTYQVEKFQEE